MKKTIIAILSAGIVVLTMAGCGNMQMVDTTYSFEKAILCLPDGKIVSGEVQSWRDYEDGDQIQVKIDGKTYLTHAENIVLISE